MHKKKLEVQIGCLGKGNCSLYSLSLHEEVFLQSLWARMRSVWLHDKIIKFVHFLKPSLVWGAPPSILLLGSRFGKLLLMFNSLISQILCQTWSFHLWKGRTSFTLLVFSSFNICHSISSKINVEKRILRFSKSVLYFTTRQVRAKTFSIGTQ